MGMMARMRGLASWFIILVGGLFVLFMVLSDSRILEFLGQQSNNVGSIDGYEVTYQEFAALVERARAAQVQQTGQEIEETQMEYFRNQVWDALVTEKLVENKMNEFGITVTDEEIRDELLGPEPPAFLKQNFIDSTGTFNREMYEAALFDPRNREILLQVEDAVRQQRMQTKLQDLLFATVSVSEDEIKQKFIDQTFKMDAEYALVNVNSIPDSTIQVTENDIEEYYNENREDYKVEPQRKVKYVLFPTKPSNGDSVGVKNNLDAIVKRLEGDTASFKTYVEIYSDQPYSLDTLSLSLIPETARVPLTTGRIGEIIGPVLTYQGYIVYRLIDSFRSNEDFVRASHILIRLGENETEAKQKADELYRQIVNGADFEKVAIENSQDQANASRGGDLGWFGRGQMVGEFEKACFDGKIGVVQKPLKTSFGYHIIKVTDKTKNKYVVEQIINKIDVSPTTYDKLYNDANDFAYLADKNDFESEAELFNYNIIESNYFSQDMTVIPGMGANKALIEFAFDNSVGSISEVYRVTSGYVVAMVSESKDVTYKPFEEVSEAIKTHLYGERKYDKTFEIASQIKSSLGSDGDLSAASQIFPRVTLNTATDFNTTANIPGIGIDYAFTNYAVKGELNKISDPIKGTRGSFLIKVINRTEFNSASYEMQRNTLMDNLLQQKKTRVFSEWMANLKKEAEIVDNRHRFYR